MRTRIHLVRHGLSKANLDLEVNRRMPDHAIELAEDGHRQAREAGTKLAEHILGVGDGSVPGFHHRRVRLMVSPYVRTRQTADGIADSFSRMGLEFDRKEHLSLREQSFGLFDGLTDDELKAEFPREHAHYDKHSSFEGEFFAPMPMGESRAMVTDRVRTVFGSILRDVSGEHMPPVTDMVVVSHGVSIRCFLLAWFNRPWEWCEREPNPANCSVTTIEGQSGRGWKQALTFPGFRRDHGTEQERREEGHVATDDAVADGAAS